MDVLRATRFKRGKLDIMVTLIQESNNAGYSVSVSEYDPNISKIIHFARYTFDYIEYAEHQYEIVSA